ncbi:MAG TPA: hypothetical protein VEG38_00080 [Acidimicrobiia bacterium]|nr:hypothetical protein [Acidimicrobiia bacterium]
MPGGGSDRLRDAEQREEQLRRNLHDLVVEQRRVQAERSRYDQRSRLEGADRRVAEAARSEEERAAELASAIESARAELRAQEGLVAKLRTERD